MDGERPDVAGGAALVLGGLSLVTAAQGHAVAEPGHVWGEDRVVLDGSLFVNQRK